MFISDFRIYFMFSTDSTSSHVMDSTEILELLKVILFDKWQKLRQKVAF